MIKRLKFLVILSLTILAIHGCSTKKSTPITLNDMHSKLNATEVAEVLQPKSTQELKEIIQTAKAKNMAISISGGKHAMGGQQFGQGTMHINMSEMNDILAFNDMTGIITVESGIQWPKLVDYLLEVQKDQWPQWGITQKQTGADRLSIGGALSANVHGRGVNFKPIIQDVESFTLVNADGELLNVSRKVNPELFKLVIGGYGLFGVIATVDLRLSHRTKLQRVVEVVKIDDVEAKAKQRIKEGYIYGDFQYKTDKEADDFMKVGVFAAYKPVPDSTPMPKPKQTLTSDKWNKLIQLAHVDKAKAFQFYSQYYLSTNDQLYWSDTHQFSVYDDGYEAYVKEVTPDYKPGSLMISEVYVPHKHFKTFMQRVSVDARGFDYNNIYGTVRLIKKDDESFLAWAQQDYACIIFNLRVEHSDAGIEKAKQDFRRLIDRSLELEGAYFLTYHRWARKDQVLKAYPQFPEFLKLKLKYDPEERFQSDWYRHYKGMFE